jgi:hypothetical protein
MMSPSHAHPPRHRSHPPNRHRQPHCPRASYKKYICFLGPLTLCVRETHDPNAFDVRVTHKPRARTFEQSLVIRPGTVLCLHSARRSRYVRTRVFNPRIQYGHLVAGGVLVVDEMQQSSAGGQQ